LKGARKVEPPRELVEWMELDSDDWTPTYPFNERHVRDAVISALYIEQRGLCVYCGRLLDTSVPGKSYHIEHFRPRNGPNGRADLAVNHTNLFLSCGQLDETGRRSQTCGTRKDDWFDEESHVEPAYPMCTKRFSFLRSGHIKPREVGDVSAIQMIDLLGLDHPELIADRAATLALLDSDELSVEDFWDGENYRAESFGHVAFEHVGRVLP